MLYEQVTDHDATGAFIAYDDYTVNWATMTELAELLKAAHAMQTARSLATSPTHPSSTRSLESMTREPRPRDAVREVGA